jgi:hypothetical protein
MRRTHEMEGRGGRDRYHAQRVNYAVSRMREDAR